jgi:hypothetical protein
MVLLAGYQLATFWLLAAMILWLLAIGLGYGLY